MSKFTDWLRGISAADRRRYEEEMTRRRLAEIEQRHRESQKRVEARKWLATASHPGFADNAIEISGLRKLVPRLYAAGAKAVYVTGFAEEEYADTLLVEVPSARADKVLLVLRKDRPDELGIVNTKNGIRTYRAWWD